MTDLEKMLTAVQAVSEAIRTLGEVPSGELYAQLCGQLDMNAYMSIIALLKRTGLVVERAHMLKWAGPVLPK